MRPGHGGWPARQRLDLSHGQGSFWSCVRVRCPPGRQSPAAGCRRRAPSRPQACQPSAGPRLPGPEWADRRPESRSLKARKQALRPGHVGAPSHALPGCCGWSLPACFSACSHSPPVSSFTATSAILPQPALPGNGFGSPPACWSSSAGSPSPALYEPASAAAARPHDSKLKS